MPSSSQTRRLLTLGGIALGLTLANGVGCNGGAVGVDACIAIEQARCELVPMSKCAGKSGVPKILTATEVANCKTLYRDHCRVGIENTTIKDPAKDQYDPCIVAITATAACASEGFPNMSGCPNAALFGNPDPTQYLPCQVFESPELLAACNFIEAPPTSTTTAAATTATTSATTTSSTTSAGGAGG